MKIKNTGFTLIELLVVVVIIGIIAAFAYPNYTNSIRNTRAEAAKACLVEVALELERHYANGLTYVGLSFPPSGAAPQLRANCLKDPVSDFYTFSYAPVPAPNPQQRAFMIRAVPINGTGQENHRCGTLAVNEQGRRLAEDNNCW